MLLVFTENAQTPYSAAVIISNVEYGTGYASSKKAAKNEAGKSPLYHLSHSLTRFYQWIEYKVGTALKPTSQVISLAIKIVIPLPNHHRNCPGAIRWYRHIANAASVLVIVSNSFIIYS